MRNRCAVKEVSVKGANVEEAFPEIVVEEVVEDGDEGDSPVIEPSATVSPDVAGNAIAKDVVMVEEGAPSTHKPASPPFTSPTSPSRKRQISASRSRSRDGIRVLAGRAVNEGGDEESRPAGRPRRRVRTDADVR